MHPLARRRIATPFVALVAAAGLGACEKTTTVTQTPSGSVTTTTLSPSADASAAIAKVDASLAAAASAVQSSDAASQALTKAGSVVEDGVVTTQAKAALLADPDVKSLHINVESHAGAVTLSGSVPDAANLGRAEQIVRGTHGVRSVENRLVVQPPS